jgi:Mrp family chromosome partitioning ATPase
MEELKQKYDVIIVDTSPIGLVSDTLSISEYADMLIYVSRIGHVKSDFLTLPQKLYNENKFKSLTVLVNGSNRSNNGYGYGYGYGDSGAEDEKKGFLKRVRSKNS